MAYVVEGLAPAPFAELIGADEDTLRAVGAQRVVVTEANAAPCRITLDDAAPGETVLLLSYTHQDADTPYRQQGPIYIRENAAHATKMRNALPPALARRMLSLRAFDAQGLMIDADVVDGKDADPVIVRLLAQDGAAYVHAHYARRGCFAAVIKPV